MDYTQTNTDEQQIVEQLEQLRQKARQKVRLAMLGGALAALAVGAASVGLISYEMRMGSSDLLTTIFGALIFTVGVGAVVFGVLWHLLVKRQYALFANQYKERYVVSVAQTLPGIAKVHYQLDGFTYDEVRNMAVVNCGTESVFESEDLLQGEIQGVRFAMADVVTKRLRRRDRRQETDLLFNGVVLRFSQALPHNAANRGWVQVFQKELLSTIKGWCAPTKYKADSEDFNKKFDIYCEETRHADAVLTASMQERLLQLAQESKAQVAVAVYGDHLYVAVDTFSSMFDPKVNIPVAEQRQRLLEDLRPLEQCAKLLLSSAGNRI